MTEPDSNEPGSGEVFLSRREIRGDGAGGELRQASLLRRNTKAKSIIPAIAPREIRRGSGTEETFAVNCPEYECVIELPELMVV